MSKNVRRRGRRRARARAKKGNWFTRMKMWQRVLLIVACVLLCVVFGAAVYVYAKWSMIDTQDIKAEDIVINDEVKKKKSILATAIRMLLFSGLIPVTGTLERGTGQIVSSWQV